MDEMMNDPYFTDGQGEYDEAEDEERKKKRWKNINMTILILHLTIPVFWVLMFYSEITAALVGCTALFCIVFREINVRCRKCKIVWNLTRGIMIFFAAISYIPAFFLMMFDNTPAMYRLKKAAFINGVTDMYSYLLPEELPEVCEDYCFDTVGHILIPEGASVSRLFFYTDTETIDEYRERCEDSDEYKKIDLSEWREGSGGTYSRFCSIMWLKEDIKNDTENNELYVTTQWYPDNTPRGILLNRKSGMVAIFA